MFDPYHRWLGIPKEAQPPTYYRLLGLAAGESDTDVIDEAAIRQTTHVRAYQIGPHAEQATRLLNEIAIAKATLLNPGKKRAYDESLAQRRNPEPTAIAAGAPAPRASSPAGVQLGDEPVVIARRRPPRDSGTSLLPWLIGGGIVGVLLIAGIVIGLVLSNRPLPPQQAVGPVEKPKPPAKPDEGLPKKNELPAVIDPVVPPKKPDEPAPKKIDEEPAPPEKKKGGGFNFPILLSKQVCSSVAVSPDLSRVAAATNPARILDAKNHQVVDTLKHQQNLLTNVRRVMYTRDGSMLLVACGNYGGVISVYDIAAAKHTLLSRKGDLAGDYIFAAAISPKGRYVASTHLKGRVFIYDVATAAEIHVLTPPSKQLDCRFLADDKRLLTAGEDGILRVWDASTGALLKQYDFAEIGSIRERHSIACLGLSPDEQWVLLGHGKYFRRFNLQTEQPHNTTGIHQDNVIAVAMTPDGQYTACAHEDGRFTIYGETVTWRYNGKVGLEKIHGIAFGADQTLWFASQRGLAPVRGWTQPKAD